MAFHHRQWTAGNNLEQLFLNLTIGQGRCCLIHCMSPLVHHANAPYETQGIAVHAQNSFLSIWVWLRVQPVALHFMISNRVHRVASRQQSFELIGWILARLKLHLVAETCYDAPRKLLPWQLVVMQPCQSKDINFSQWGSAAQLTTS